MIPPTDPQTPLIEARDIGFGYEPGRPILRNVSFALPQGGSLGIVGESGSGKTTLLRLLLGLETPDSGQILVEGRVFDARSRLALRSHRHFVQPVFQDPYSSLDPRQRIDRIITEPLKALAVPGDRKAQVAAALQSVGLPLDSASRYPHEFSGGQRQRIAIARALAPRPRVLLADEPVSALDLSTRLVIVDLLRELARDVTLVLVSHDLAVVAALCTDMIVLEKGKIVEAGPVRRVIDAPRHPYTERLLDSLPHMPAA